MRRLPLGADFISGAVRNREGGSRYDARSRFSRILCVSSSEFRSANEHTSNDLKRPSKNVIENISINCYPNPSTDYINITLPDLDEAKTNSLSIIDNNGRVISVVQLTSSNQKIELSSLQSGVYVLEVQLGVDRILKRIIKI